jgi:hypothetical protein
VASLVYTCAYEGGIGEADTWRKRRRDVSDGDWTTFRSGASLGVAYNLLDHGTRCSIQAGDRIRKVFMLQIDTKMMP